MTIFENLIDNQFATGGLFILILTTSLYVGKHIILKLYQAIKKLLVYELTIQGNNRSLSMVGSYIVNQCSSFRSEALEVQYKYDASRDESDPIDLSYRPWQTKKLLRYKSKYILINHEKSERQNQDIEYLIVYTFIWNKKLIYDLCEDARKHKLNFSKDHILVMRWDITQKDWRESPQILKRPINSIYLDNNNQINILNNILHFYSKEQRDFYNTHGIPYKKNILLHGPPGNGKTSLIKSIASELNKNIYLIDLSHKDITDNDLSLAITSANGIIILEDIDCLTPTNRDDTSKNITFSGLLNALDGVVSADGVITFITTNYKEKLDDALIRAGRIDLIYEIGNPNIEQIKLLITSLMGYLDMDILDTSMKNNFSMADIQQLCMKRRLISDSRI